MFTNNDSVKITNNKRYATRRTLTIQQNDARILRVKHQDCPQGDLPIAFASKTLARTKVVYAQEETETLAIIFGLNRFRQDCYADCGIRSQTDCFCNE
jgi:hypothetical protein